ncbi:hypothetical protein PCE1_000555 [Barthelona sp. PCE]
MSVLYRPSESAKDLIPYSGNFLFDKNSVTFAYGKRCSIRLLELLLNERLSVETRHDAAILLSSEIMHQETKFQIIQANGLESLIDILHKPLGFLLKTRIFEILAQLVLLPQGVTHLDESGRLLDLFEFVKMEGDNIDLAVTAASFFSSLAVTMRGHELILSAQIVRYAVPFIHADANVTGPILRMIIELSHYKETQEQLLRSKFVTRVIDMIDYPHYAVWCLRCLANVCHTQEGRLQCLYGDILDESMKLVNTNSAEVRFALCEFFSQFFIELRVKQKLHSFKDELLLLYFEFAEPIKTLARLSLQHALEVTEIREFFRQSIPFDDWKDLCAKYLSENSFEEE